MDIEAHTVDSMAVLVEDLLRLVKDVEEQACLFCVCSWSIDSKEVLVTGSAWNRRIAGGPLVRSGDDQVAETWLPGKRGRDAKVLVLPTPEFS